jgi:hypothetical protein
VQLCGLRTGPPAARKEIVARHVARREVQKERDHLGDLGINGRVIVRWILKRLGVMCGLSSSTPG